MPTPRRRCLIFAMGLVTASAPAGCRAVKTTPPVVAGGEAQAAVCPKCEIVWFKTLDMNDSYMVSYGTQRATVCAECRSAVDNFFKTGRLVHTCKTCDATLQRCPVRGD